jgi:23S rRNA (cytosine1962-C5)-methyltransferase
MWSRRPILFSGRSPYRRLWCQPSPGHRDASAKARILSFLCSHQGPAFQIENHQRCEWQVGKPAGLCYTESMGDARATVVLKQGREKPVRNRHPWVFSGAVHRYDGEAEDGDVVRVRDYHGAYLATGYLNRRSQIVVRLLTWDPDQAVNADFWRARLDRAVAGRNGLEADAETDAYRLVHGEADGLPGLVVDRYGEWLVVQCLTLGIAGFRDELVELLAQRLNPTGIYARDDASVRRKEGLPLQSGTLQGPEPPELLRILEHGCSFLVDIKRGHKTGFYLDQRENRWRVAAHCSGARVLNAFSYTGGFGVYAGCSGARSVTNIDTSIAALELAERNVALNGCEPQEMIAGDAFQVVRGYREEGLSFDVVILDPPKFATAQSNVLEATRGYKDVNMLAMQLLRRGGLLATFSCSGLVSTDLFQKVLFGASVDAGRDVQILQHLSQGPDHPVMLTFPESAYLKGFLCRVW